LANASFRSVAEIFLHRVASTPDSDAFYYPMLPSAEWKTLSWKDVGNEVREIACGLRALGLESEQRVSLLSNTRVEWLLCDIGIMCAAGATTTIYPSNTPTECEFIINDSDTRFVICEDASQLDKLLSVRAAMPQVKHVVIIDGKSGHDGWVVSLDDLKRKGRERHQATPAQYEEVARSVESHHLATLIYTSGTTGMPKGVELTHDNWVFEGEAMDAIGVMSPADKQYLWLPMAHSFGKVLEVALIRIGIPTAIDGRIDKIVENLAVVKPTFVAAVPRIFEKVYNKVVSGAKDGGGVKYKIFTWALGVGKEVSQLKQAGKKPVGLLGIKYGIADKLVFSKLKARFGGRLRFFISGSAALNRDIAEFFHAADMLILEGYGLTETSAASYVNRLEKYKFGTVGLPVPGVEVRIAEEDGEILLGGRGIMRGYHNNPEANAETLDNGWLRTGDIGVIDADGFLKITDRKKDLIKTSGGKYVAPQNLEGKLKASCTYLSQVIVHGNNRNFCSALITLEPDNLAKWGNDNGHPGKTYAELTQLPEVRALIQPFIDQLNASEPSYSTIKKFAILTKDFSIEDGDLTPSQKVKRKAIEGKNKALLDGFYAGAMQEM
jgi:long-chain acyl-CoA synthetase